MDEQEARSLGAKIHKSGESLPMTDEWHNATQKEQQWMMEGWEASYQEFQQEQLRKRGGVTSQPDAKQSKMELAPGTPVRMKSGTEGWVKGIVVEYFDVIPSVGGMILTGPSYKVKVLEGKHKGEVVRLPANFVQEIEGYTPSEKRLLEKAGVAEIARWDAMYSIRQLQEMARSAGVSPHRLRDAHATRWCKRDGSTDSIRILQEQLGHADIGTTMKYRKVAGEELQDFYRRMTAEQVAT